MSLLQKRQLIFFIGITLNSLANALFFKGALSSSTWGIAAMNLSVTFNITSGFAISIASCSLYVLCRILEKKIPDIYSLLGLLGAFIFGFYIDFFSRLIQDFPVTYPFRLLYTVVGVILLAYSIAIYLKANYIILPIDESIKVFANKFFAGDMTKGGYLLFSLAVITAFISGFIINHNLIGFNLYSVVIFFCFSPAIGFFSKNTKYVDNFLELSIPISDSTIKNNV